LSRPFDALPALAALASVGCSLQGDAFDECSTNRQCSAAFGLGSVCASDGLCAAPVRHPRCADSFPADLFSDPIKHRDTIVFRSLFNLDNTAQRARQDSVRLALEQIDLEGGVDGRSFGLVACNIAPEPGDEAALTLDGRSMLPDT
jgi:hypothetical protein